MRGRSNRSYGRSFKQKSRESDNRPPTRDDDIVRTQQAFIAPSPTVKRQTVKPAQPNTRTKLQQPRAQMPNLDDIGNEFAAAEQRQGVGGGGGGNKRYRQGQVPSDYDERRRYVDYDEQYATTGVKNKLKDKYKRGKKSKKGSSIFGTLEANQSGNSVLDSYRSLGKSLR